MDEDADRDPEPPARIKKQRERLAELQRQFSKRRQELEEKAAADPWDYWPETHDDKYNPASEQQFPPVHITLIGWFCDTCFGSTVQCASAIASLQSVAAA